MLNAAKKTALLVLELETFAVQTHVHGYHNTVQTAFTLVCMKTDW